MKELIKAKDVLSDREKLEEQLSNVINELIRIACDFKYKYSYQECNGELKEFLINYENLLRVLIDDLFKYETNHKKIYKGDK